MREYWRERNCPHCRREYNFYAPNINIHATIGRLRVHCPNEQYGCIAEVSLYQLENHKARTCTQRPIQCEQGCGLRHPNLPHTADVFIENLRNMVAERQLKVEQQERIAEERRRDALQMQQQRDAARNDAARCRYQRNWYREDFNRLQQEYIDLDELQSDTARRLQPMEVQSRQRQEIFTDLAARLRRYTPYALRSRSVVAPNIRPRSLFARFNATSPQPGPANNGEIATPRAQPNEPPTTPRNPYLHPLIIKEVVENADELQPPLEPYINQLIIEELDEYVDEPQPPPPAEIEIVEISSTECSDDEEEEDDAYDYVEADSP